MRQKNAKQRILETADALFTRRGYGAVGINEIIEKSGTAKASFYNHYESKERLCTTWLESVHERSEKHHEALLESNTDPLKIVEEYFLSLKSWLKDNNYRGCPYTNTRAGVSGDSQAIQEKVDEHKLFLRDFFIELARRFTPGRPARNLGTTLFLLYSGATTEAQNMKTTWPIEAAATAAVDLCRSAKERTSA